MEYKKKYLKYKHKYLELKGGVPPGINCQSKLEVINNIAKNVNMQDKTKITSIKQIINNEFDTDIYNIEEMDKPIRVEPNFQRPVPLLQRQNPLVQNQNLLLQNQNPLVQRVLKNQQELVNPIQKLDNPIQKLDNPLQVVGQKIDLNPPKIVVNPLQNINEPIEAEIELYFPMPLYGGDSNNIWPLINRKWKILKRLGIKGKINANLNFIINAKNEKNQAPILGRGTYTAVYEISNALNKYDTNKYILRIYERNLDIAPVHFMKTTKIMNEYKNYNNYLIKIFYYGELKLRDNEFRLIESKTNSDYDTYINLSTVKNFNFDYTITKLYNIPSLGIDNYVNNLTNLKKFVFLYNNVVMLKKLADNNEFHADYKIANVGWEDEAKLNVILIDYDDETIQEASSINKKFKINSMGIVNDFYFASTYIPEYLSDGKGGILAKCLPAQFIKYSVGGLYMIIAHLNIKFKQSVIQLTVNNQNIKFNLNHLGESLKLNSKDYNSIPSYDYIISVLEAIPTNALM
jgi:hypothetical protein